MSCSPPSILCSLSSPFIPWTAEKIRDHFTLWCKYISSPRICAFNLLYNYTVGFFLSMSKQPEYQGIKDVSRQKVHPVDMPPRCSVWPCFSDLQNTSKLLRSFKEFILEPALYEPVRSFDSQCVCVCVCVCIKRERENEDCQESIHPCNVKNIEGRYKIQERVHIGQ